MPQVGVEVEEPQREKAPGRNWALSGTALVAMVGSFLAGAVPYQVNLGGYESNIACGPPVTARLTPDDSESWCFHAAGGRCVLALVLIALALSLSAVSLEILIRSPDPVDSQAPTGGVFLLLGTAVLAGLALLLGGFLALVLIFGHFPGNQ